ncbi:centrosomal protein of 97 kDa isoform X2 [Bacillus rossius redtenbacheri]|uniref:centrosomal protein of 97 kDa isoform X2 n=1 Tax=Bacillus rossius redtenbacheri TaxID=93214 RepID=UPI002FDDE282
MDGEVSEQVDTLNLSKRGIKKLSKSQPGHAQAVKTLILDGNELQRWDNIDSYPGLTKLSAVDNQLLRMYGVSRLHHLTSLNLAHNSILTIEGLKDLSQLRWLCLASNKIQAIEHLQTNVQLEYLDLSENKITHIADISYLKSLQELLLHSNRISQLRQCERHLPTSLVSLTLANNNISDLNEVSNLAHLTVLRELSIANNPCVAMTGKSLGFDYRPFLINWCMSLKVIDGYVVDALEGLKAEWLYSQGRGRQFRAGEHQALVEYLAGACPLSGDALQSEEERKLRLILSKAQQHQQQLREQVTESSNTRGTRPRGSSLNRSQSSPAPSPASQRRVRSARSQRSGGSKTPGMDVPKLDSRMASSCHAAISSDYNASGLMSQSLDPSLLFATSSYAKDSVGTAQSDISSGNTGSEMGGEDSSCQLQAASKLVPVPESLMSPDYRPANTVPSKFGRGAGACDKAPGATRGSPKMPRGAAPRPVQARPDAPGVGPAPPPGRLEASSEDEDSEMSASKLEVIRHRAQEKWQRKETVTPVQSDASVAEKAAVCIQRMWRGYRTRNLDQKVQGVIKDIQASRIQDHVVKLMTEMEATRTMMEWERKQRELHMQAISALWKKMVTLEPGNKESGEGAASGATQCTNTNTVQNLTTLCVHLKGQVDQLQTVVERMWSLYRQQAAPREAAATQTDVVAVHSPDCEEGASFPLQRAGRAAAGGGPGRPSSLPIPQRARAPLPPAAAEPRELRQFATSLVDGVLRNVAEARVDATSAATDNHSCGDVAEERADQGAPLATHCTASTNGNPEPVCARSEVADAGGRDLAAPADACELTSPNNNQQPQGVVANGSLTCK